MRTDAMTNKTFLPAELDYKLFMNFTTLFKIMILARIIIYLK